jgi:hypothetical protein
MLDELIFIISALEFSSYVSRRHCLGLNTAARKLLRRRPGRRPSSNKSSARRGARPQARSVFRAGANAVPQNPRRVTILRLGERGRQVFKPL